MAAFNSTATPSGRDGMGLNVNTGANPLGMGVFDPDMPFDESILENVQGLQNMPYTPAYDFEQFSATFEDPFSYPSRPSFTAAPPGSVATTTASIAAVSAGPSHGGRHVHHHHHHSTIDLDAGFADPESSPPDSDVDNKLLSFSGPITHATLLDETGQSVEVALTAELYGMFFVAEDVFSGDSSMGGSRPHELTCYRRNLWQCSGHVAIPRRVTHVALPPDQGGATAPLLELAVSITATESIDGKPTEIISIPWKSSNPNAAAGDDHSKSAGAPPQISLDMTDGGGGGQEPDGSFVSAPVSWKRLQFKHATANNGRRKGLQQHYVVQVSLLGRLGLAQQQSFDGGDGLPAPSSPAGGFVKLAEVQSGPVIVRGRSPRNFDSRKDVQLISDKKPERRSVSNDPVSAAAAATKSEYVKGEVPHKGQSHQAQGNTQASNLLSMYMSGVSPTSWANTDCHSLQQNADWTYNSGGNGGNPHSSKRAAVSPNPNRPPVPSWSGPSEPPHRQQQQQTASAMAMRRPSAAPPPPTLPINLSLSEDERSPPNRSSVDSLSSPQLGKRRTASGHNPGGSPVESADLLYEYFPLSLDDFLDPVDAVYRPHVVHHIRTVEENPRPVRGGTKRYFVPD
ncbi:transcriptional regulator PacG/VIB-1 [Gaeumannomyces tritici R3-111a-1]|uniref:Transcriptional regulator PacG/VIB-1 n=1 Tax=Gaeumannomyces tritici (strain R3-111a-1) TaxID=644352 RepID=J3P0F2_GAET3|nr:transcriptional regulator PacG/VIB-1 [Gaeumannomyces tritici R3-111a-1]EJT77086.1 transcriptional regulator PacG/VIB-1 [Gaeumannomyces tritici R3-111a-1]